MNAGQAPGICQAGQWNHLGLVYDGRASIVTLTAYWNGTPMKVATRSGGPFNLIWGSGDWGMLGIPNQPGGGGDPIIGAVGECRAGNALRSNAYMKAYYKTAAGLYV